MKIKFPMDERKKKYIELLKNARADLKSGKFTCIKDYTRFFRTENFNSCMVLGVDKDSDEAIAERADFIRYHQMLSTFYSNTKRRNGSLFNKISSETEETQEYLDENQAIAYLKSLGYKILKPEYKEV